MGVGALRSAHGGSICVGVVSNPERTGVFLRNASHLIHDRDPLFTKAWTAVLKSSGVKCVPIPAHSPNCSPHAERFVRTIRTECLDEFVIFGERHLRYLIKHFMDHYLTGRCHQGIGGRIIVPRASAENHNSAFGAIRCRSRLGGLLNHYYREAARCGSWDSTGAVLGISIVEQHLRSATEWRGSTQLLGGSRLSRRASHGKVDDALRVHVHDEEGEDRTEPDPAFAAR